LVYELKKAHILSNILEISNWCSLLF